ncbi:DUF2220 family protein, partial [Tsukamurella tyrosinosolvens]|uniref:Wadjet anti-phage system protein JetD domain-containing protein n=1 Tax=Tsukamurella tyrosinosolvens TaxID=57704 RepID=UPI002480C8D1
AELVLDGVRVPDSSAFPWIRDARYVVFWGDIDRDGYEILDGYREAFDRDIDSIMMDPETYEAYEEFGTDLDQHGRALEAGIPRPVGRLRDGERSVYLSILSDGHIGRRRVEQERIPLDRALDAVTRICGQSPCSGDNAPESGTIRR